MNIAVNDTIVNWLRTLANRAGWNPNQWKDYAEEMGWKVTNIDIPYENGVVAQSGTVREHGYEIFTCTFHEVTLKSWDGRAVMTINLENFFPCKIAVVKGFINMMEHGSFELSCSGHTLLWTLACINNKEVVTRWTNVQRHQYRRNIYYLEDYFRECYPYSIGEEDLLK